MYVWYNRFASCRTFVLYDSDLNESLKRTNSDISAFKMQCIRMDIQVKMPDNLLKHLAEVDYRFFYSFFALPTKEKRMRIRETNEE